MRMFKLFKTNMEITTMIHLCFVVSYLQILIQSGFKMICVKHTANYIPLLKHASWFFPGFKQRKHGYLFVHQHQLSFYI